MMLRKRHGTGIKPAVDDFGNTLHLACAFGTTQGYGIDIGTVQFNVVGAVVGHRLEFFNASDAMPVTATAFPDIQGSSPITVS